jgi:hypothetical protein
MSATQVEEIEFNAYQGAATKVVGTALCQGFLFGCYRVSGFMSPKTQALIFADLGLMPKYSDLIVWQSNLSSSRKDDLLPVNVFSSLAEE